MAQEIKMSAAGLKAMQEELEYLKTVRRKELVEQGDGQGVQRPAVRTGGRDKPHQRGRGGQPRRLRIVDPQAAFAWLATLPRQPRLVRMPDTSHFFHRKLIDLRGALKHGVQDWLPAA